MGLRRTPVAQLPAVSDLLPEPAGMPSLVAAAAQMQLEGQSSNAFRFRDLEWQREAWRQLDINGEFRFAANRHASALSRCRLYVAELDALGRPGKEAKDPQVQVLSETIFGGPAAKGEALRVIGVQNYVAGECYAVAEAATSSKESDNWYVVSPAELRRSDGGAGVKVKRPMTIGGGWRELTKGKDMLMRIWTPHPRMFDLADSPSRAVLPILREIERLTQLCFSQIDSRLISAGILLMREGIDFPHAEGTTGGVQGLMDMILEAARAQLSGAGTAAGLVPIMATVPTGDNRYADISQSFAHIKFDTPLTAEIEKKLDQAIRRLALGLDIAPEDLLGQGDANHWGSWQIEESSIKLFIEPVLVRICDALTTAYLKPALKALKLDPDGFTLWYDTSPLTVRPNRMEDATGLWDRGLLNDEAMIAAGNFDGDDLPNAKAQLKWMMWQIVKANPPLIAAPGIAKLLGVPPEIVALGLEPPPPPPVPPQPEMLPPDGQDPNALPAAPEPYQDPNAIPEMPTDQATPAQQGKRKPKTQGVQAAAFAAMVPATEQVVLRALELAGNRLLTRNNRAQYAEVARFDMHTRVSVLDAEQAAVLMQGAWAHVPTLARHYQVPAAELEHLLAQYCSELLIRGHPHDADLLTLVLAKAGLSRDPA